jgi:hypothetical protein
MESNNGSKPAELIGKFYELLNIDNSIMVRFKINHTKYEVIPAKDHSDGSHSPSHEILMVSENGSGWYVVYGGSTDRIINN